MEFRTTDRQTLKTYFKKETHYSSSSSSDEDEDEDQFRMVNLSKTSSSRMNVESDKFTTIKQQAEMALKSDNIIVAMQKYELSNYILVLLSYKDHVIRPTNTSQGEECALC